MTPGPVLTAARSGIARGRIELKHTFTNPQDLWTYLFPAAALLVVMFFMRDSTVPGLVSAMGVIALALQLAPGLFLLDGLQAASWQAWATLGWW